jgi:WD40 repeat protein
LNFALTRAEGGDPRRASATNDANRVGADGPEPAVIKCEQSIFRVAWDPSGRTIAAVGLGFDAKEKAPRSTLLIWDPEKRALRRSVAMDIGTSIESICFSPNGKMLAIAAVERAGQATYAVRLIDPGSGATRKTIPLDGTVRSVVYSPDGKTLAIGGQEIPKTTTGPFIRTVQLRDVENGAMVREFRQELRVDDLSKSGQLDGLRDLVYSPDGKLLAAADVDFRVRLIDVRTGGVQQTLEGHTEVVLALAFSPDGKMLASGGFDGTARIWDAKTGKAIRTLEGTKGPVWRASFSPSGRLLATGGSAVDAGARRGEAILWDARLWQLIRVLPANKGVLESPAFSPDGKQLAIGVGTPEGGGAIELWQSGDLIQDRQ